MKKFTDSEISDVFIDKFASVPEVQNALRYIKQNESGMFLNLLNSYLKLTNDLVNLDEVDLKNIKEIHGNFKKLVTAGGVEEPSAYLFVTTLGKNRLHYITEATILMANPESQLFNFGLSELAVMMGKAYKLKAQGKVFSDTDLASDQVIWTQTKITNPYSITHIVIAHFFERCILHYLKEMDPSLTFTKDYFLNILDDVILLEAIKTPGKSVVFNIWNKSREEGGLSYINPDKVKAYKNKYLNFKIVN